MTVLAPERALRAPRRLNTRALLGLVLALAGIVLSLAVFASLAQTRPVLVGAREVPSGQPLVPEDLVVSQVRLDDSLYAAAVPAADLPQVLGRPLAEPLHPQQILARAQLGGGPALGPGQQAMTIPIRPETAVGGRIHPGDHVRLLVTTGSPLSATAGQNGPVQTRTVLTDVVALDIGHSASLSLVTTDLSNRVAEQGPVAWLTLAVGPDQATALATARWSGQLDVVLLSPAARQP